MIMKKIEEDLNQIELLKQALLFYANKENYDDVNKLDVISPIEADEFGSQARFALKKIQEIQDQNQKLEDDYNKVIDETINIIENNPLDLTKIIKTMKNIGDAD